MAQGSRRKAEFAGRADDWIIAAAAIIFGLASVLGDLGLVAIPEKAAQVGGTILAVLLLLALAWKVARIEHAVEDLHADDWNSITSRIVARFDARRDDLLIDLVRENLELLEAKSVRMGRRSFDRIYRRVYEHCVGDEVIGPTLARAGYYWTAFSLVTRDLDDLNPAEQAIQQFTDPNKGDGAVRRVFYVPPGWASDERVLGVLARQVIQLRVKAKVIEVAEPLSRELFVLFRKKRFGWEAYVDPNTGRLTEFEFTGNESRIQQFERDFDGLWSSDISVTVSEASRLGPLWETHVRALRETLGRA